MNLPVAISAARALYCCVESDDDLAMPVLVLPPIDARTEMRGQKKRIFDLVRKKMVTLTPEEWVRQHVLHYLVHRLQVPLPLIAVEKGHRWNRMSKRCDVLVYKNAAAALLVECKAPNVALTQQVLKQALLYNRHTNSPLLMVTNGLKASVCHIRPGAVRYVQTLPRFEEW